MNHENVSRLQSITVRLGARLTKADKKLLEAMPPVATKLAEMAEGKGSTALVWPWAIFLLRPQVYTAPTLEWGRVTHVGVSGMRLTEAVRSSVAWRDVLAVVTRETLLARGAQGLCNRTTTAGLQRWQALLKRQNEARARFADRLEALYSARARAAVDGANLLDDAL